MSQRLLAWIIGILFALSFLCALIAAHLSDPTLADLQGREPISVSLPSLDVPSELLPEAPHEAEVSMETLYPIPESVAGSSWGNLEQVQLQGMMEPPVLGTGSAFYTPGDLWYGVPPAVQ